MPTPDTFGSILGLIQQATGNNNNNWGTVYNNSFANPIERAISGVNTIGATSGTVDLSTTLPPAGLRLDIDHIQLLNGALTADLTIKVPNLQKTWWFWNRTSGAFNVFVQVPGGVASTTPTGLGGLVQIPQGLNVLVVCDGAGNLIRHDDREIGTYVHSGKTVADAGELICDGSSKLIAEFPNLFAKIGKTWGSVDATHFTLPKLTDTNRYLRAADGTTITVGTYQANQNVTHTHAGAAFSGTTATENAAHNHTGSGTTSTDSNDHVHGYNEPQPAPIDIPGGSAGPSVPGSQAANTGGVNAFHTHTYSFTTATEGQAHAHAFSGSTGTIPASGGTEARPESAAVLICIRY